ncbi:MAG: hypothetical protein ACOYWZ_06260 [Bacillota bacterium]
MKKLKLLSIFLLAPFYMGLLSAGCEKDDIIIENSHGIVLYYGNPSVDGCGWMIKIDTLLYSPINLDSVYQKDSTKVLLDYKILTSIWNCGWRQPGYQQIEILKISKKIP